jgi:hypothetical protein
VIACSQPVKNVRLIKLPRFLVIASIALVMGILDTQRLARLRELVGLLRHAFFGYQKGLMMYVCRLIVLPQRLDSDQVWMMTGVIDRRRILHYSLKSSSSDSTN